MNDSDRAVLSYLKQFYGKDYVIAPSALRAETVLTNANPNVSFNIKRGVVAPSPTEVLLDNNDAFCVTHMGLFLTAESTTQTLKGVASLQTYPNPIIFPAVAAGASSAFVPGNLEAVYNGSLSVKVGTKELIPALDTIRFRRVPQTQKSAATNSTEFDFEDSIIRITPNLTLKGNQENVIGLRLPNATEIEARTAGTENRVVLYLKGFVVKGGSSAGREANS